MTERTIHTDRKLKFESARGTFELTMNAGGLTIKMFVATKDGEFGGHVDSENLPIELAREIRDFLAYALDGEPMAVIVDDDDHVERRVIDRRTKVAP